MKDHLQFMYEAVSGVGRSGSSAGWPLFDLDTHHCRHTCGCARGGPVDQRPFLERIWRKTTLADVGEEKSVSDFTRWIGSLISAHGMNQLTLDLGCGQSRYLDAYAGRVISVDLDRDTQADVIARAEQLPFRDGTFVFATAFQIFSFLEGDISLARDELRRVLSPEGRALVSVTLKHRGDVLQARMSHEWCQFWSEKFSSTRIARRWRYTVYRLESREFGTENSTRRSGLLRWLTSA